MTVRTPRCLRAYRPGTPPPAPPSRWLIREIPDVDRVDGPDLTIEIDSSLGWERGRWHLVNLNDVNTPSA